MAQLDTVIVHVSAVLSVTFGRLDEDGNLRQPTEFQFVLPDQRPESYAELKALVALKREELIASLEAEARRGRQSQTGVSPVGSVPDSAGDARAARRERDAKRRAAVVSHAAKNGDR